MKYPCNFDDYNTLKMSNYKEIVVLNDVPVEIPIVGSLETGSNILQAGNTDSSFVGWYLWTWFRKPDDEIYQLVDSERIDEEM